MAAVFEKNNSTHNTYVTLYGQAVHLGPRVGKENCVWTMVVVARTR